MASLFSLVMVVMVFIAQTPAFAVTTTSMKCSGGIVSEGDPASDILAKCGQPFYATQREQKIGNEGFSGEYIVSSIFIDDWTFNFGPDRLQYRVILRNGTVWRIDSLYYGY